MSTTQQVVIPFRGSEVTLSVPSTWRIGVPLRPNPVEALEDPKATLREALRSPIGRDALVPGSLEGKRVVIAVDDVTRPTPVAQR